MNAINLAINQILSAAAALVRLAILCDFLITLRQSERKRDMARFVHYTKQVVQQIQKVILSVWDNATGARGYLIAGNDQILKFIEAINAAAFICLPGNKYNR